jgi:hypothetical protein
MFYSARTIASILRNEDMVNPVLFGCNRWPGDNPVVLSAIVDFKIDGYVLPGFGANDGLARQPKG